MRHFGNLQIGRPYTYREFDNIADDIENPTYARVYTEASDFSNE